MKRKIKKQLILASGLIAAFVLWTAAVCLVDVQVIGPQGSHVGFAAVNGLVHRVTGVHMTLYTVTDWLGLVPFGTALGFAVLGLVQWIRRKKLAAVDRSILILGGFYLVVAAVYVIFEICVINYRPVLIEGILEASYPSSTTMLVMCVMPTAILQLSGRIPNKTVRRWAAGVIAAFVLFMVVGRFISGVHWFSDIVGGALLSAGLVVLYDACCKLADDTQGQKKTEVQR